METTDRELTIPEVRAQLYELGDALGSTRLIYLANQLWRRRAGRRPVHPRSRAATEKLRADIRAYVKEHPDEPEDRVGDHFGVNQGRVSEALFGFRGRSTP